MSIKPQRSSKLKSVDIIEKSYSDLLSKNLNEDTWSCTVVLIIEKNPDYKKYVKSFEDAAKFGQRPVIKNISMKDLETDVVKNKPNVSKKIKGAVKKSETSLPSGTSEKNQTAERILKIIHRLKEEDMKLMNARNKGIETCKIRQTDKAKSAELSVNKEQEMIRDEPLCGPSLYIVLTGFYHLEVLVQLLQFVVPVELILSFTPTDTDEANRESNSEEDLKRGTIQLKNSGKTIDPDSSSFWADYIEFIKTENGQQLLFNLIELDCNPEEILTEIDGRKQNEVNDLIYHYTCKKIFEIQTRKREYVHFIRNTKRLQLDLVKTTCIEKMSLYYKSISSIPLQIITIDHILNCLIDQIEYDEKQTVTLDENQSESLLNENFEEASNTEINVEDENAELSSDSSYDIRRKQGQKNFGFNLSSVVVEFKNDRGIQMNSCSDYYMKFQDYYVRILERSVCPLIWRFYPRSDGKDRLLAVSHFQKLSRFFETGDSEIAELVLHKKVFNQMFLTAVDPRNVDLFAQEVFDGILASCSSDEMFRSGEGEEEISNDRETENKITLDQIYQSLTPTINYLQATKDTQRPSNENQLNTAINEPLNNLNKLVSKYKEELKELKNFLKFPELDNLFSDCFDALVDFNIIQSYSKQTTLHLLNLYTRIYNFIQFSYFSATDSLLFVFHNGLNENHLVSTYSDVHLLTHLGFRDYSQNLTKIFHYSSWIRGQSRQIDRENAESLQRLKVILGEDDAERCCYRKIKSYGLFPINEAQINYQSHAPHPLAEFTKADENDTPFTAYDLKPNRFENCSEKSTMFVSKLGARISIKSKIVFNLQLDLISFDHPLCSIFYEFSRSGKDAGNTLDKVNCETDNGIRLLFVHKKNNLLNKNAFKSRRSESERRGSKRLIETDLGSIDEPENEALITLPNGLQISKFLIDGEVFGIKQKHLGNSDLEKYRLYLRDGTVLVFTDTGNIVVYYSNTTITTIKRVCSEKEFDTICGNDSSLQENKRNENNNARKSTVPKNISYEREKKGSYYVIGEHEVLSWSGLVKLFKFNHCCGSAYKYFLRTAYDQEKALFTLRSDGTKSHLDLDGVLVTQFPDGTRITSTPTERITLLSETDSASRDSSSEEWVLINLHHFIEQPDNYMPVEVNRGEWIVHLPGSKKLSFTDLNWTSLKTSETELCFDGLNQVVYFNIYNQFTRSFGNFLISLDPDKENLISRFKDEDFCFTIDSKCKTNLTENRFEEDVASLFIYQTHWERLRNFSNYLTENPLSKHGFPENTSETSSSDGRYYIFKPTAQQKNIKMLVLRRDLSGYELTNASNKDAFNPSLKNSKEYKNGNYTLSLWNLIPPTTCMKLPYKNSSCFSSSDLRRNNLTQPLPTNQIWLFSATDRHDSYSHELKQRENSELIRNRSTSNVNKRKLTQNVPLVLLRKHLDLISFQGIELSIHEALESYLNYKKYIYSAILKNTFHDIKSKHKDIENS